MGTKVQNVVGVNQNSTLHTSKVKPLIKTEKVDSPILTPVEEKTAEERVVSVCYVNTADTSYNGSDKGLQLLEMSDPHDIVMHEEVIHSQ